MCPVYAGDTLCGWHLSERLFCRRNSSGYYNAKARNILSGSGETTVDGRSAAQGYWTLPLQSTALRPAEVPHSEWGGGLRYYMHANTLSGSLPSTALPEGLRHSRLFTMTADNWMSSVKTAVAECFSLHLLVRQSCCSDRMPHSVSPV